MNNKPRNSYITSRRREASALDLRKALDRSQESVAGRRRTLASPSARPETPKAFIFPENLPKEGTVYNPERPATRELKDIIEKNYYTANFEDAIATVSKQQIPELDKIKTLDQFYYYVDQLVTWIPEIRVWDWNGETIHERTPYLRICQFYYYFNQPSLVALQSPITPVEGAILSPVSLWLREFAVEWGEFLSTPESSEHLESFKYAPEYCCQEFEEPSGGYDSFNAFFVRTFKEIAIQRPVAQEDNDRVIVFPAESTFVGHWPVSTDMGAPLPCPPSVVVKHIEWPIKELLQDSEYKDFFEGGTFCHSFLNTYDYHRQHTPVSGKVLEAKFIPGQVYLDVQVQDQAKTGLEHGDIARAVIPQRFLDADDPTGYQFVQCRGLIILDSPIGKVAILPMGMAQVSSVVFVTPKANKHQPILLSSEEKAGRSYDEQVKLVNEKITKELVGKTLSKGEMFSYFQFGGSDCVMVFERKANVNFTAEIGAHYLLRSQYAISNINKIEKV
ncbi:MAG: phosphatidylserine decarboxylase [Crocinitomicaceae bacterium]|nr:phosphatidylserine decarboxylase [Crocinitomicaceae bacterium]